MFLFLFVLIQLFHIFSSESFPCMAFVHISLLSEYMLHTNKIILKIFLPYEYSKPFSFSFHAVKYLLFECHWHTISTCFQNNLLPVVLHDESSLTDPWWNKYKFCVYFLTSSADDFQIEKYFHLSVTQMLFASHYFLFFERQYDKMLVRFWRCDFRIEPCVYKKYV